MVLSIKFDSARALACATERGWTQAEWAERAGVSLQTLKSFLSGGQRLKLITVEQIIMALGYRAADFARLEPPLKIRPAARELARA